MKKHNERRGVTLFELLAVVTILGIVASIAMARFGRSIMADFGSHAEARQLSLAFLHAQRASITTGDNHYVAFDATSATSYSLFRVTGTGDVLVDGPHPLESDSTITVSATRMEFTFEGQTEGLIDYTVTLQGENRTWQMTIIPISGAVQVAEI